MWVEWSRVGNGGSGLEREAGREESVWRRGKGRRGRGGRRVCGMSGTGGEGEGGMVMSREWRQSGKVRLK